MFIHNINPVAFSIGPLDIHYYGIIYALGFLIAYFMIPWVAKKRGIKNLDKNTVGDLLVWIIIGNLVGARLFHVLFYNPIYYFQNSLEIFMLWKGGLSFHGALIGIILAVYLFGKKHKIKFYDMADTIVVPAAFALFLGRIANFVNGELVGKITDVNWCVVFKNYEGCRHPSQIYEALKNLLTFGVLMFIVPKAKKKGVLFWTFVLMYGVLRFSIEFFKDVGWTFLGLNTGQWLCIPMIIVGIVFLVKINRN